MRSAEAAPSGFCCAMQLARGDDGGGGRFDLDVAQTVGSGPADFGIGMLARGPQRRGSGSPESPQPVSGFLTHLERFIVELLDQPANIVRLGGNPARTKNSTKFISAGSPHEHWPRAPARPVERGFEVAVSAGRARRKTTTSGRQRGAMKTALGTWAGRLYSG